MAATPKVLVLGASGFIGSSLMKVWPAANCVGTFLKRPLVNGIRFDIANERLADRLLLRGHHFTHAVLAQGVTKLDECAQSPDISAAANVLGTIRAINDLLDAGVHPIFLSSDAVFDGTAGPRSEQEPTCPILSYGRQKVTVEEHLQAQASPWTILRLCKVVAGFVDDRNPLSVWLSKVMQAEPILCATDQILTPVNVDDVVRALGFFITTGEVGIYHVAGSQIFTRHGLLMELLKHAPAHYRQLAIVRACKLSEISASEPLPLNCSLSNNKLRALYGFETSAMENLCVRLCRSFFLPAPSPAPNEQKLLGETQTPGSNDRHLEL